MSTAANITEPRFLNVEVTEDEIIAHVRDGRTISVPLAWSWRLAEATLEQRQHFTILGDGQGLHWPDIDEDISAEGMLHGSPARRSANRRSNPRKTAGWDERSESHQILAMY